MSYKKEKKGQLTINIYAFFFSLVAFLFVLQLGAGVIGALMRFSYPGNLSPLDDFWSIFGAVSSLTVVFMLASQVGTIVIRRAEASPKIFVVYNLIVLFIMFTGAVWIFYVYRQIWFILPNVITILGTIFALRNRQRSRQEIVESSWAYKREQKNKEKRKHEPPRY